uniref:Solute carrier family 40 member n=1 Tax=Haemonchus contortus TaxID=6289 RepID=A0A7I4Z1E1_HAECO
MHLLPIKSKSNFLLYAAYLSTCLEDRAWSFCVSLCMQALGGMRMVSIEQFAEGVGQMILSGHLGRVFDRTSRKTAIMSVVPLNNLSIVLAASMFIVCLSVEAHSPWFTTFLVLGIFTCAVNRLFLNAEKFLVSRDWVVVLSDGNTLSSLNATLTALDQLTNVISPIITGVLVTAWGLRVTCAIFGAFSLVSMASKAFFLRALYVRKPKLAHKEREATKEKCEGKTSRGSRVVAVLESIPDVLRTYVRQTVIAAAFGMALLFMTVMGFDGLAVGYGQSAGLQDFVLGAFRSYGSAMGILGALSYAFFERRLGVRKTGLLGLTCQQICLIVAVISIWLPGSPFDPKGYFHGQSAQELKDIVEPKPTKSGQSLDSIITFLSEIATARFGLWMADLSIIHIMQEGVPESDRNTVFGVHNALCQTFSVLKDVLVIILPDPSTFGICILISNGFVTSGYFSFVYYLLKHPPTQKQNSSDEGNDELQETRL